MCIGFGGILTRTGEIFFPTPDLGLDCSHSALLKALGIPDNHSPFNRNFVRWECSDWSAASFEWDENGTLPGWAEELAVEAQDKIAKLCERIAPAYAEYQKVNAPALAEYEKVNVPAYAEYQKVRSAAWEEYEKVRDAAREKFLKSYQKLPGYVAV